MANESKMYKITGCQFQFESVCADVSILCTALIAGQDNLQEPQDRQAARAKLRLTGFRKEIHRKAAIRRAFYNRGK